MLYLVIFAVLAVENLRCSLSRGVHRNASALRQSWWMGEAGASSCFSPSLIYALAFLEAIIDGDVQMTCSAVHRRANLLLFCLNFYDFDAQINARLNHIHVEVVSKKIMEVNCDE
jgi:hypothetical protein